MSASQRRKGAAWERELVHRFAAAMPGLPVRRGLQQRQGAEVPDVDAPPFWVEAKVGKKPNPRAALVQAIEDSAGKGRWPVAVVKDDYQQPFAVMPLDDFLELVSAWWELSNE